MPAELRLEELLAGLRQLGSRGAAGTAAPSALAAGPGAPAAPAVADTDREGSLQALATLLRDFAGFRPTPHLQRKLDQALRHLDAIGLARLVAELQADGSRRDLLAIVEDLANHETYFFRDPMQLDVVAQHILPAAIRRKAAGGDRTLRLWSAACATGEEAWTLALIALQALLDAKQARESRPGEVELLNGWRLEVLGTDISRPALRVARDGAYSDNVLSSFRQFPSPFMRFFEPQAGAGPRYWRVRDAVRRHVAFESFNLVGGTPPRLNCDVVLCRNVLIYIDPAAQPAIQQGLRDALRPGGHLVLGVVDRLWQREGFHEHWQGRTVTYERK